MVTEESMTRERIKAGQHLKGTPHVVQQDIKVFVASKMSTDIISKEKKRKAEVNRSFCSP